MKKRILIAQNYSHNDISSFLRAHGPFTLGHMRDEVEIFVPFKEDGVDYKNGWWNNFRNWVGVDVCFLHRPFGVYGMAIIEAAKSHGVPLWIDHDDDLLKIPEKNPCFGIVKENETTNSVEHSYREADILTCHSHQMKRELINKYGREDVILIPMGLDDRLLKFKKPFNMSDHRPNNDLKKISWRGSPSHLSDIDVYREAMSEVKEKLPNREWIFFGLDPGLGTSTVIPEVPLFMFYTILSAVNASTHHVPLEDNPFNRNKANISWIDATLAGSVCLVPDWEEWQVPGVFKYDSVESYKMGLANMATAFSTDLRQRHARAWQYIDDVLRTSVLNGTRLQILRNL